VPDVQAILDTDVTENAAIDTRLLNELIVGRVDCIISEDRDVERRARQLKIADRVFTIEAFLEKVNAENPALADYKVLTARFSSARSTSSSPSAPARPGSRPAAGWPR
jgi:hypothetical protein